jgi:hypothetical protein
MKKAMKLERDVGKDYPPYELQVGEIYLPVKHRFDVLYHQNYPPICIDQ